jgi:hypothetical protein
MAAHQIWDQLSAGFPAQTDPGDAGTFTCDRFFNYLPITSAGSETRTIAIPDKACFLAIHHLSDGGDVLVGFNGAIDMSGNVAATFNTTGDMLYMYALPNSLGWRLIANDGTTLS